MIKEKIVNGVIIDEGEAEIGVAITPKSIAKSIEYANSNKIENVYFKNNKEGIVNTNDYSLMVKLKPKSISFHDSSFETASFPIIKSVEKIFINEYRSVIDFSKFPNIKECTLNWNQKVKSMEICKDLKKLVIWKYHPKSKSLKEISELKQLEYLQLNQTNIQSLNGIEKLTNLKHFELNHASKLRLLNGIQFLSENLNFLLIDHAKKISDHNIVKKLRYLKKLSLNDCGSISSINFLDSMLNLEDFIFVDTNVIDGNLTPCLRLKYTGFSDKRHYSHKREELKKLSKMRNDEN